MPRYTTTLDEDWTNAINASSKNNKPRGTPEEIAKAREDVKIAMEKALLARKKVE